MFFSCTIVYTVDSVCDVCHSDTPAAEYRAQCGRILTLVNEQVQKLKPRQKHMALPLKRRLLMHFLDDIDVND